MTKDLEQHWNEYMRTKSTRVRELLIKQYQPLVEYVANGFKYSGSSVLEHQDLISAGLTIRETQTAFIAAQDQS